MIQFSAVPSNTYQPREVLSLIACAKSVTNPVIGAPAPAGGACGEP
jgi:hypothetical protein